MILQRLAEFQSTLDAVPSGYKEVFQTRRIRLNLDGTLDGDPEGLTGRTQGSGKTLRHGAAIVVPREQPGRTVGNRPRLVHDDVDYAFGLAKGEEPNLIKVAERHRLYIDLLERAAEATGEPSLRSVLTFVRSGTAAELIAAGKLLAGDALHFLVDDIDPSRLPAVEMFWRTENESYAKRNRQDGTDNLGYCLVTGEWTEIGQPMPEPIKGIPGGQMSGNMLVSVNFDAAESYGLQGNRGAPVSAPVSEAICKGLNHLTSNRNHHYRAGGDLYVYWIRGKAERDALAPIKDPYQDSELTGAARRLARRKPHEPVPEDIEKVFQSFVTGMRSASVAQENFHLVSLAANAARIVVRDSMEASLADVIAAQGRWLQKLELEDVKVPGLSALAGSLYRDAKDIPKGVSLHLAKAALAGTAIPDFLLILAVRRNVIENGPYVDNPKAPWLRYARISLIKAILSDKFTHLELSKMITVNSQPPYVCGRLLAVLDTIQYYAHRDPSTKKAKVNSTLVDRHYGSFSTTPNLAIGPLMSMATKAHLPKIRKSSPGVHAALNERLEEVTLLLSEELPATFNYVQQGLFALGFYHQKAHDRASVRKDLEQGADNALSDLAEGNDLQTASDEGDDK